MKRKVKLCMSFALATVLATGSISPVSADEELGEGAGTGMGELEGNVKTDIYQVVMPTNAEGTFDFILDPQGLINKTNGAAYNGMTFEEDSTLFFRRRDGNADVDFSSKSDMVTIINKSSTAVDVSVNIEVVESSIEGITMTDDIEFGNDTGASLYLALVDEDNVVPIGENGASIDVTIDAAPNGAYEYVYDSENGEYTYGLKEDLSDVVFDEYSFQLIGATNGKGDWSSVSSENPQIIITWNVSSSSEEALKEDTVLDTDVDFDE